MILRAAVAFFCFLAAATLAFANPFEEGGRRAAFFGGAFSPRQIPRLVAWYDASDASTITLGTGSSIAQWSDKSGASHHLTQNTSAQQPTLLTNAQNGKNGIRFTAASTQFFNLVSPVSLSSGGHTTFMVTRKSSAAGNSIGLNATDGTLAYLIFINSADTIYTASNGNRFYKTTLGTTTLTHLYTIDQAFSAADLFIDSISFSMTATGGAGGGTSFTRFGALAATFSDSVILEYLTYDAILSRAQEKQVETYLKSKWATP